MHMIPVVQMKFGDVADIPGTAEFYNEQGKFEVKNAEGGILLVLFGGEGGEIRILSGNTVFAGKPVCIELEPSAEKIVRLESGLFAHKEADGSYSIRVESECEGFSAYAVLLN